MKILGISAFYHDSAAALIEDGTIKYAVQEERFSRKKHDARFPSAAIRYILDEAGLDGSKLDAVVFYDKPLLKFERLLETYYFNAPKGLFSFHKAMPVWIREKLFLKKILNDELKKIKGFNAGKAKLLFPEHHLSHAASAFYPSPFERAAILTIDGVGEWATASIAHGYGNKIKVLMELDFPHSVGLLYSSFTYFLGFRVNSGEYKLMGLAPYGRPGAQSTREYVAIIKDKLVSIKEDGSIWLNPAWFSYATGLRMVEDKKWAALFGMERRGPESALEQKHCDLALAIQLVTEEIVLKMAATAKRLTGENTLCMAGGVALNCVANGKIQEAGIFDEIFIQPAAGDAGGAPGAALAAYHIHFEKEREISAGRDAMEGSYLGPEYSSTEIRRSLRSFDAVSVEYENDEKLCREAASCIASGRALGWMQGRMEFGPRALGNRSILGDPRDPGMQKKLNLKIKYRESFRPFAPAVLAEEASKWFKLTAPSPYMLMVHPLAESIRKTIPEGYENFNLREKLYTLRSEVPAITHVDFSARIQTVHKESNLLFHQLISEFNKLTGCPILVNTSFNVRGEPIVCSPEDAYKCFMRTEMDDLFIGRFHFRKEDQPKWEEKENWEKEFILD